MHLEEILLCSRRYFTYGDSNWMQQLCIPYYIGEDNQMINPETEKSDNNGYPSSFFMPDAKHKKNPEAAGFGVF